MCGQHVIFSSQKRLKIRQQIISAKRDAVILIFDLLASRKRARQPRLNKAHSPHTRRGDQSYSIVIYLVMNILIVLAGFLAIAGAVGPSTSKVVCYYNSKSYVRECKYDFFCYCDIFFCSQRFFCVLFVTTVSQLLFLCF